MDPAEFLWLFVFAVCLGWALVEFDWLPIVLDWLPRAWLPRVVDWLVVVCLMSALFIINAVGLLLVLHRWPISRSVDENAETTLLEAWANRISLGNEFEILPEQLLKLGALLTSVRGFRTNNSELKELVEELQQLKYQAENLLDELDYYRLEDQIQQRGGAQEKGNYISNSSAATSSSGFRLASRSILSTLKGMSGLVSLPKTYFSRINLSRRMNELAKELQKSEEKVRHALLREVYPSKELGLTAWNTNISHTEAKKLHQTSSFLTEATKVNQTSSFLTEPVFGRDQECDQLMNLLTNEESAMVGKVPVIAIVGSGGVGKTTLARLVFTDPKIPNYFEVRLWICVSTQFDSVRLTREIMGLCGNKYDELSNLNELQKILKDKLESKRFLLVLDDMWEDEHKSQWDLMVAPLNYCRVRGSIILVTTRKQSVAKLVGARDIIYLQGLDNNAFSSFFSTCIFNDPNYGGNGMLRIIGEKIADKLKGNPLAAKTVAAMLVDKTHDVQSWIKIMDNEEWIYQSGPNDIMPALEVSYKHMPIHLQRCFSCCAIFPEDHPFTCKELVYLWMAQGFLDVRSERKLMEDIGSAYFNDLLNFGFFQIKQSKDGLVYYTFNDFIHDLAHSVAFKECLTIDGTKPRQILPTIRHLSISGSTERSENAIVAALACLKGENLSTIIIWDDELPSGVCQSISDLLKKNEISPCNEIKTRFHGTTT